MKFNHLIGEIIAHTCYELVNPKVRGALICKREILNKISHLHGSEYDQFKSALADHSLNLVTRNNHLAVERIR